MTSKSGARSARLSNLNSRMISTVLKNEKLADRNLQAKLKSITANERKSMVRLGETSLHVKYDWRRRRNSIQNEEDEVQVDKGTAPVSPVLSRPKMPGRLVRSSKSDINDPLFKPQTGSKSPRSASPQIYRRPTIVIDSESGNPESENDVSSSSSLSKSVPNLNDDQETGQNDSNDEPLGNSLTPSPSVYQRRRTAPEITPISPKLLLQLAKNLPQVQPTSDSDSEKLPPIPRKISLTSPEPERRICEPSTPPAIRKSPRPTSPRPSSSLEVHNLDIPGKCVLGEVVDKLAAGAGRPPSARSRSPSPSRLSLEAPQISLARRRSEPPRIDPNSLSSSSPLRKACAVGEEKCSTLNPTPVSPRMLRRLSGNESVLQDRVDDFLKSFSKKT